MKRINLQLFALNKYLQMTDTGSGSSNKKQSEKTTVTKGPSPGKKEEVKKNVAAMQSTNNTSKATTPAATTPVAPTVTVVESPTLSPSTYSKSDAVIQAENEANAYLENVKKISSITDIVDQKTWDAINKQFATSNAYEEAMAYTNELLKQLSSGRTSYTDQISDLMAQIQGREDFSYDVDADPLFQQALASAMGSGKVAMQDTIGQAAALTGGYGSTYGTTAGNQAYNAFIEDAYNNLPEYYQMALEAYQMEGQEMYNQLAMLNDADAKEYQRTYDSWNANFNNAQQMYQKEYGAWQDSVNNAFSSANLQLQEHGQLYDQAYNTYNAVQNHANNLYAQEYQKWADEVANVLNYAQYNESVRQYNTNLAQSQNQQAQDLAYKYAALAQDQEQFNASQKASSSSNSNSGSAKNSESSLKNPTETQMNKALEAFNTNGEDGLAQYIDSLVGVNDQEIIDYVYQYGNREEEASDIKWWQKKMVFPE